MLAVEAVSNGGNVRGWGILLLPLTGRFDSVPKLQAD